MSRAVQDVESGTAKARDAVDRQKEALDVLEARLGLEIRRNPEANGLDKVSGRVLFARRRATIEAVEKNLPTTRVSFPAEVPPAVRAREEAAMLAETRPTAINLRWAIGRMLARLRGVASVLEGVGMLQRGECSMRYLQELLALCETMQLASKCGLGQSSPNAFVSIVKHFKDEIMEQMKAFRDQGGKFVIPIPDPTVI